MYIVGCLFLGGCSLLVHFGWRFSRAVTHASVASTTLPWRRASRTCSTTTQWFELSYRGYASGEHVDAVARPREHFPGRVEVLASLETIAD